MTDAVKGELEGKKFGMYADIEKYKDIDEDAILATLTEEELKQLEDELDPDVSIDWLVDYLIIDWLIDWLYRWFNSCALTLTL